MTNNAQLLPLPEGSLICWTPNPEGPCDIVYTPEQMQSYALACIEAAQPADALGSLPVVEGIAADDWIDGAWDDTHGSGLFATSDAIRQFADHAQATAEIAKRDAEIESIRFLSDFNIGRIQVMEEELTTLRAKLSGVGGLVNVLRAIIDNGPFTTGQKALLDAGSAALATYEAAQGTK